MKSFEAGKTYDVNGSQAGRIYIEKRTRCYVWFSGTVLGKQRCKVYRCFENGLFGLGEHILISSSLSNMTHFCFAGHEVE